MRKFLAISLAGVFLILLCSCGTETGDNDTISALEQENASLQSRIEELEEENNLLKPTETATATISDNTSAASTDADDEDSPTTVALNSPFMVGDVMEVTLTGSEWNDVIVPPNTSKFYTTRGDKDGETYFIIHGMITSYATDSFNIKTSCGASILINGKYKFSAKMEFEDLDGAGFGDPIKPLQTRNFIIYSSVSDEAYSICESVQVDFGIPDNEKQLSYFYDEDNSNGYYTIVFEGTPAE
jgi:hypothetical protein